MGPDLSGTADFGGAVALSGEDITVGRLDDQISWYDRKSRYNQRSYKLLKCAEIAAAALIPFSAGLRASVFLTGTLGLLVVLLEGIQSLNQYYANWIGYRTTCEALKHEKYLYSATAGPYSTASDPHALLAERVESLISQEHAKWVSVREEAAKTKSKG